MKNDTESSLLSGEMHAFHQAVIPLPAGNAPKSTLKCSRNQGKSTLFLSFNFVNFFAAFPKIVPIKFRIYSSADDNPREGYSQMFFFIKDKKR